MSIVIRAAALADMPRLGQMGAALVRMHHHFDAERFFLSDDLEAGYRWWFTKERRRASVVLLVAAQAAEVVGYAYAREEPKDWNLLRDRCGILHDLWVEPHARREGAGRMLLEAAAERLREMGVPRMVLMSASANTEAQAFFQRQGFRPTMVEMARELPERARPRRLRK